MHDEDEAPTNPMRVVIGVALLLVGGVLVLDRLGIVNRHAMPSLFDLWPALLVVIGVRAWIHTEGVARWFGIAFTVGGLALLADRLELASDLLGDLGHLLRVENVVPVALVAGGLFFLLGGRLNRSGVVDEGQRLGHLTMFGGAELIPRTPDFRGGWLAAIFGGFEVDLRGCDVSRRESQLDVVCMFGGGDIRVPETWEVELTGLPLFGGFGSDVKRPEGVMPTHRLKIRCVAMFGGLSVES